MSNTKDVHSKRRLHVSLSTCYLEHGRQGAKTADWWMVNNIREVDFHTATAHTTYMYI